MKILERIALVFFSIIMVILAVTSCLVIFNVVELKTIFKIIEELLKDDIAKKIIIGISVVSILLSIKALFFPSRIKKKQEIKTGVLLENKDGRLLISKDTIENLVNSVVKSFDEAVDVQTKINLDLNNKITVYVSLLVKEDSVIKELSANMQNKIKETIKRSTDLEVDQVNINIKDIESTKNNKTNSKNNNQTKINLNNVQISKTQNNEKENEKRPKEITVVGKSIENNVENDNKE